MKKFLLFLGALASVVVLQTAIKTHAAPNPPALGGTGTSVIPVSGQTLIGNGSGTYTPALLTPGTDIVIQNASGSVTIAVNASAFLPSSTVFVATVNGQSGAVTITSSTLGVATNTLSLFNGNGFTTTTIASVLKTLTASGLATYNSSTGAFAVSSSSLLLGSASQKSSTDFLASSTVFVSSVNGQSGAVTITAVATTTINNAQAAIFRIIGDGSTVTSTVSGATTTFSILTTGNWVGTWQGVNSSTFYLASNPNGYISSAPATATINGTNGNTFTFIASSTGNALSITTSTNGIVNLLLQLSQFLTNALQSLNGATSSNQTIVGTNGLSVSTAASSTNSTTTIAITGPLTVPGSQTSTITGDGTPSYIQNFDTTIHASTTSSGDYGAYLNTLCSNATVNASSALIILPQINVGYSTGIVSTARCTFKGVGGNGTILRWTGAQGGIMANANFGMTPHVTGGGFEGITFDNSANSATTTNPTVCLLLGGTNGAAHALVQYNTFIGCGNAIQVATGSYDIGIYFNTIRASGHSIISNSASNSGESIHIAFNWIVDPAFNNAADCVLFSSASVEKSDMTNNTTDNCQIHVMNQNQVFIYGTEIENAGGIYGNYTPFLVDNSNSSNVLISGGQAQNDGTLASTTFAFIVNAGSNVAIQDFTVTANSGALSVPQFLTAAAGTGNENVSMSGIVNKNSGFTALAGNSGLPCGSATALIGTLYQYHNSYLYGTCQDGSNSASTINGGGPTVTNSVVAGGGSGTGVTNYFGGALHGTSTIDDGGSLALSVAVSAASTSVKGPEGASPINGSVTYVFTGSGAATDTLPIVGSSTGRFYIFKNRGTGTLSIAASTTVATDFLWLSGVNASATTYSLLPGSSTAFQNDGTYWDQLWK